MNCQFEVLCKKTAEQYADRLVDLHNLIPFQYWSKEELLADGDSKRRYERKWDISFLCKVDNLPVGICIAFIEFRNNPACYIHRIAVDRLYRNNGIGRQLLLYVAREACVVMDLFGIETYLKTPFVYADSPLNADIMVVDFYKKMNFIVVDEIKSNIMMEYVLKAYFNFSAFHFESLND